MNTLNAHTEDGRGDDECASGIAMGFLASYLPDTAWPEGAPYLTSALTFPLPDSHAGLFSTDFSTASIRFEHVQQAHGVVLMKIQLQVGTTRLVWLADALDPALGLAMRCWWAIQAVPVVVAVENEDKWDHRIYMPSIPAHCPQQDNLGLRIGESQSPKLWTTAMAYAMRLVVAGAELDETVLCTAAHPPLSDRTPPEIFVAKRRQGR